MTCHTARLIASFALGFVVVFVGLRLSLLLARGLAALFEPRGPGE